VPEDSSQVAEEVTWPIPREAEGHCRMEVELTNAEGEELSQNWFEFRVTRKRIQPSSRGTASCAC